MSEVDFIMVPWEAGEYIICLNGKPIGDTLTKQDANKILAWLKVAQNEIMQIIPEAPVPWTTGQFTAQFALYNMLMAWSPEQCREFYAMLSQRPDFAPTAMTSEQSPTREQEARTV